MAAWPTSTRCSPARRATAPGRTGRRGSAACMCPQGRRECPRRRDDGLPFGTQAAMAKLFASDAAMRVATDAVQILGGYGYVTDFPAERYLREAKALQIVEGTNQIQRLVIGRALGRRRAEAGRLP